MTTSSPATSPTESVRASAIPPTLLARLAARAIDTITALFVTLTIVLIGLAPAIDALSDRVAPDPWGRGFCATVLFAVVATVYEMSFLVANGQTPGKDLLNLRVVDRATGEPPRWGAAALRTLPFTALRLVPGVLAGTAAPLVLGIGAPTAPRRRGLHDRFAGTEVIRYDAAAVEGDPPRVDRDELAERYGPRSIWELVTSGRDRD